ncbi:DUF234 domain-containing protein [Streptomyces sp. NPDC002932]|uniref:DUF234 domain-containing protein n=1 Tax=Streptomyces sp. NPDC002932 TaxID=3364672 RepID=UPI00367DF927
MEDAVAQAERGRGDVSAARIQRSWPSWRGRAVEPVIRESLARRVPDGLFPEATGAGGGWSRQNSPEVDLIGADAQPVARRVAFVGSVKWRDETPFGARDLPELAASAQQAPGAQDAALVAVSRRPPTRAAAEGFAAHWGPHAVIAAWR